MENQPIVKTLPGLGTFRQADEILHGLGRFVGE